MQAMRVAADCNEISASSVITPRSGVPELCRHGRLLTSLPASGNPPASIQPGLLGRCGRRCSCLTRMMSGSRGSRGSGGPTGLRLPALAVRRCLVIRICDIPHPSWFGSCRSLPSRVVRGVAHCRHGQHPHRHPAGCGRPDPASGTAGTAASVRGWRALAVMPDRRRRAMLAEAEPAPSPAARFLVVTTITHLA
jgi:hypothetical protein